MTASIQLWLFYALCAYFVLFAAAALGLAIWKVRRRNDRPPVKFKLLRAPGETLRRKLAKFDEGFLFRIAGAAVTPIAASFVPFIAMRWVFTPTTWPQFYAWIAAMLVPFCVVLVLALRWVVRDLHRIRNHRLGYLGEREVAEQLAPLATAGFRIFHDVPADGTQKLFNLDHVVIGPSGVAVVETKTRRKGRARPGFKDHVVTYDGRQLIWPWAEDRHGLDQALAEADWLRSFIRQRTGIDTLPRPILALPGWWVEATGSGPVAVVNSKMAASAAQRGSRMLSDEQIDLISRQLDAHCRDVED